MVGAGMGGISAAHKLQTLGHTVTLLEGRDRLGHLSDGLEMLSWLSKKSSLL